MKNKLSQSSNAIHEVTSNPASKPFINSFSSLMLHVYISFRVYTNGNEAERLKKDTTRIVQRANKIWDKNAMK